MRLCKDNAPCVVASVLGVTRAPSTAHAWRQCCLVPPALKTSIDDEHHMCASVIASAAFASFLAWALRSARVYFPSTMDECIS